MLSRVLNLVNSIRRPLFSFFAPPAATPATPTAPIVQNLEAPKPALFYPDPKKKVLREKNGKFLVVKVVGFGPAPSTYRVRRPRHKASFVVPASQLRPRSCDIVAAAQV